MERIKEGVIRRGAWLLEQRRLTGFNPVSQPDKTLVSGESFHLLGRHYRLKVFGSSYDSVDILDDRLILNCIAPKDLEHKRALMINWYLRRATEILTERFRLHAYAFNHGSIAVAIKLLAKRWGEFHQSKNLVVLNVELVVAPVECIDYVIIHELCHADCLHHGPEFEALLTNRLPRWRDLKAALESHSNGLCGLVGQC